MVCLIGARQVGKTTLARQVAGQSNAARFFDLENPAHLAQLADPMLALEPLRGLVILDEIQRVPDLFTVLRVLSDRPRRPAAFLVPGSASPDLLRQSSESLAGRIHYHEVGGFDLTETGADVWRDHDPSTLLVDGCGISTGRSGTAPRSRARWRSERLRSLDTSTCSHRRWSSTSFLRGSRISASGKSRPPRSMCAIRVFFILC